MYDNIALGLRLRNLPRQIIDSRVKMAAHFFNITDILEKKIRVINEAQKHALHLDVLLYANQKSFWSMKILPDRTNIAEKK